MANPLLELFGDSEEKEGEVTTSLPPEIEEGNIEYKLKLLNPSASRFEHLVTQMKWRLQEGRGEAIYQIGVADCGALKGLSEAELDASLETLSRMAHRLGATASTLRRRPAPCSLHEQVKRYVAEVLVRKVPDDQQFLDTRLAVLGSMEAGKSTLLGVLTQGELDNGRGKARLNLFRHLHEIQSGRTSSISHEIMGLTSAGEVVNYATHSSAEEICEASAKLLTFIDLAGHQKYIKTTVFGLTAGKPDLAVLVVGANLGVVGTTCEHLGFCIALRVPTLVVVSKIDLCSQQVVDQTVSQLEDLLTSPGCRKTPRVIRTENDAYTTAQQLNEVCPIFLISNVTGKNLDLLIKFLNTVPKQPSEEAEQERAEFRVDEVYSVPDVGTVVGGILVRGVIREGDCMMIGPGDNCEFIPTKITSIQRYRSCCRLVKAGQAATLALSHVDRSTLRKGTVLLEPDCTVLEGAFSCWEFTADVFLLQNKGSGVKRGFQATVYVASSMQTATIDNIIDRENEPLVMSDKASVRFRFLKHPEFLRVGSRILFRDGQTKGMGQVVKLHKTEETRKQ